MFGIFEIAIGIGVFIFYKVASGWTQPAGEEEKSENRKKEDHSEQQDEGEETPQPSPTEYPALREDVVQQYYNDLKGVRIFEVAIRNMEEELRNRGLRDPHSAYWPEGDNVNLYYARLQDVLQQLLHPKMVATVRADPQDWNRDAIKMSMTYNPQYSRPLEVQDHQS